MKRYTILFFLLSSFLFSYAQTPASVLTVGADEQNVGVAEGTRYDRIEMVRQIPSGQLTALAVPALVDGYFFGADAERYAVLKVESNGEGNVFTVRRMKDLEDFQAGTLYVVKPEIDTQTIYSLTAGITTAVGTGQRALECFAIPMQDVTRDHSVDQLDVKALENLVLERETGEDYDLKVADMNADGSLRVGDVTLMVNCIVRGANRLVIVEE